MARGLTRDQIGVSEEMIATYGERIWEMSTNIQVRRGDPVRELDWAEIEAQREGTGMSDAEIAERIGLTRDQVLYIRVLLERRRYRRHHYNRLLELGGGRRFRRERFVDHEDRFAFSEAAVALRRALKFDPETARRYLARGHWNGDTVSRWLARRVETQPDHAALVGPSGPLSYADVHGRALRLANALLAIGLRKGDVIAIQLPNVPEFVIAYFAVCMMGGVLSPLHMPYRAGEAEPLLRHGHARAVIVGPRGEAYDAPRTMLDLKARVVGLEHVIVAGSDRTATRSDPPGTLSLAALIDGAAAEIADPPVATDPAILCFTSGTSSAPKAVVHSYQTLLANNRLAAPIYGMRRDDVVLCGPPFTHAFGIAAMDFILYAGATSLLMPAFSPAAFAETIERGRPTIVFCAPAHIAACLKSGSLAGRDLSSIRLMTISGSACPDDLARAAQDLLPNGRVGQMWGMTECFMGLHTPFEASEDVRLTSLGGPTPTFEARMVGADGKPLPDGAEGELEIRGASLFAGYFGNDEANRAAFAEDGWFRTGDLAVRGPDGPIRLTGRVKDLINRGGVKINPVDIEALMDRHPSVLQSAMAPVPDPVLGERACLFVTVKPGSGLTLDEACAYLAANHVAKMKWPERLAIVAEMPMTPTRKIIKGELVRRLAGAAG
jgi:cyclohexanecarboxylate-CoA ligase/acyl-CoA synthetase